MTTKSVMLVFVVALLFSSCDLKKHENEKASLQVKVDSLVALVQNNQEMEKILQEADVLMDSIDANRNVLRYRMREGTSFQDFTSRIGELNDYVKRSTAKINDLETALRTSKQSGSSYSARVNDLKKSLEKGNQDIAALQEQVTKYKNDNDNLVKTVNLQQAEIEDKLTQISTRQEEVAKLEVRINEILTRARQNEADAYFARAEALELAAVRTNFAPKKKKITRQEALDMYRMAVLYGKNEAQVKVNELAKKL
jgi:chromosome segregation ATPase